MGWSTLYRAATAGLILGLAACGGSDDEPETGIETLVYADWNGNGRYDASEERGVLKVEVELTGTAMAETDGEGIAQFAVGAGSYRARIHKMPPEWRVTSAPEVEVTVAAGMLAEAAFGIRPNVAAGRIPYKYVLSGDSITAGYTQNEDLSYSVDGYDVRLRPRLEQHFGRAALANRSLPGTKSPCGAAMIGSRLSGALGLLDCTCVPPRPRGEDPHAGDPESSTSRDTEPFGPPAYVLILYGTNDTNDPGSCITPDCRNVFAGCNAPAQIERMIRSVRQAGAIPVLGTVLPGLKVGCEPQWNDRFNFTIEALNAEIRDLAAATDTPLADYWKAFRSSKSPQLQDLISDHKLWTTNEGRQRCGPGLHPTRRGYELMAEVAYLTITGQPSPYDDTPVPQAKPLALALEEYRRFMDETGFKPEPLPALQR